MRTTRSVERIKLDVRNNVALQKGQFVRQTVISLSYYLGSNSSRVLSDFHDQSLFLRA